MAQIKSFNGVLYNTEKLNTLADVVTPPYDVISKEQQDDFYECHPNNIIRLILGKPTDNDCTIDNPHTRAADYFNSWLDEGILIQDKQPALYLTSIGFKINGIDYTRFGLLALVKLEPFDKGIILPHEKTFSKIKSERLELMKCCHTNFCPIFSLYSDKRQTLANVFNRIVEKNQPDFDFSDRLGQHHRMWRITDTADCQIVADGLANIPLYIADGHHRYETALAYRDWVAQNDDSFDENHPANYIMMNLTAMEDPGLIILPAHRILTQTSDDVKNGFAQLAQRLFAVETLDFSADRKTEVFDQFTCSLAANTDDNRIGVYIKDQNQFLILSPKPGMVDSVCKDQSQALKALDVTVLTQLIFLDLLGYDVDALDDPNLIIYSSVLKDAVEKVDSGKGQIAFILNPTKIEQVIHIAEQGSIMPRKSTYFYPKVITGLVQNRLVCNC